MLFHTRQAPRRSARLFLPLILGWVCAAPTSGADLELRVGIARESSLPLAAVQNGVLSGLAIDLSRRLTDYLGMELTLSLIPQRDLVAALKGGRIDLITTTDPQDELNAQRLLASEPLLSAGQITLMRDQDLERFPRQMDALLTEGKVGFERGSHAARIVHELMPKAQRVPFAHDYEALGALYAGAIDLFVIDALQGWNLLANPEDDPLVALIDPLSKEQLVWAVRESDRPLLARINAAIQEWQDDGTLPAVISTWIPMRLENNDSSD